MKLLRGIAMLARFRAEGFAAFGADRQAFLNSLAPLIAFPLVGLLLMLLGGAGWDALSDLLATLIALLGPPVLSEALARRWGREAEWPRYAVAFNWCQWAVPVVGVALLAGFGMAMRAGLGQRAAALLVLLGLFAYALALHLFLARRGLGLPTGRAVALVLLVNFGTALLVLIPRLLAGTLVEGP